MFKVFQLLFAKVLKHSPGTNSSGTHPVSYFLKKLVLQLKNVYHYVFIYLFHLLM